MQTIQEHPGTPENVDVVTDMRTAQLTWHALWTRSRHEKVVHSQLTQKGIESFLPTVSRFSRWRDRTKRVEWPLFPGYCFARFNPDLSVPVLSCSGVVTIVSMNGRPVSIPIEDVENMKRLVETDLTYDACPMTSEGTVLTVVSGPLKGVVGRVIRKDLKRATLVLSIELINQAVRVQVDVADVNSK